MLVWELKLTQQSTPSDQRGLVPENPAGEVLAVSGEHAVAEADAQLWMSAVQEPGREQRVWVLGRPRAGEGQLLRVDEAFLISVNVVEDN